MTRRTFDLRIVVVSELPSFHNPFKCGLRDRFDVPIEHARNAAAREQITAWHAARGSQPPWPWQATASAAPRRHAWELWRPSTTAVATAQAKRDDDIENDMQQYMRGRPVDALRGDLGTQRDPLSADDAQRISRDVRATLTPQEAQQCQYHRFDWVSIARTACELVDTHGDTLTYEIIGAAAGHLARQDQRMLTSLFSHPIGWYPDSRSLTDGQHRSCGLFVSGAKYVPVEPGPSEL